MSNMYNVTQPNVSVTMDNTTFDVMSGASLNVTGSGDTILLEIGGGAGKVWGNNNWISGAGVDSLNIDINGSGNAVTTGDDAYVFEEAGSSGNRITVGAGSDVEAFGTDTTIYATAGGTLINIMGMSPTTNNDTIYAFNDSIHLRKPLSQTETATVYGNGNAISGSDKCILNLNGSNNTVGVGGKMEIVTSGGTLTNGSNGLVLTGNIVASGVTLTGGVMTVQMGNGNVATLSGVSSGTQIEYINAAGQATWTTLNDSGLVPVGQLAAAMASYSAPAGGVSSGTPAQTQAQPMLFASASH